MVVRFALTPEESTTATDQQSGKVMKLKKVQMGGVCFISADEYDLLNGAVKSYPYSINAVSEDN